MQTISKLPNFRLWRTLGVLGLLGSIVVGIGEFMVHFNPAGFEGENFAFFEGSLTMHSPSGIS